MDSSVRSQASQRAGAEADIERASVPLPTDPSDARYEVVEEVVSLANEVAETPAAPGSATTVRTQVFGSPCPEERLLFAYAAAVVSFP